MCAKLTQVFLLFKDLGTFATNLYLLDWLDGLLGGAEQQQQQQRKRDSLSERQDLRREAEELQSTFKNLLSCIRPSPEILAPKVWKLIEILREYRQHPNFSAIIFVKVRHHCSILSDVIRRVEDLDYIRPDHLVGHGGSGDASGMMTMAAKEVRRTSVWILECLFRSDERSITARVNGGKISKARDESTLCDPDRGRRPRFPRLQSSHQVRLYGNDNRVMRTVPDILGPYVIG
jgi:hypothetical protein